MEISIAVFTTFYGLLIGSFLNALIYRLPRGINTALPRSACPECKKIITWYENIPVLSFIFLRGKCSNCKTSISFGYPLVELSAGAIAFLLAPKDLSAYELMNFFFYFAVFSAFLVHFIVDLKHQILPDQVNLFLGLLFLVVSVLTQPWTYWALGGAIGFGFPLLVTWVFYLLKGQVGLGGGDIKLYGALGLFLGPVGIMQNIFLSCFLGAVVGLLLMGFKIIKRDHPIPFGPFIILVSSFQIFLPGLFAELISYIP